MEGCCPYSTRLLHTSDLCNLPFVLLSNLGNGGNTLLYQRAKINNNCSGSRREGNNDVARKGSKREETKIQEEAERQGEKKKKRVR